MFDPTEDPHTGPAQPEGPRPAGSLTASRGGATGAQGPGERATGEGLKRAILDEARRVLVESGFQGLSTRKIAKAVGCTATSIYLYFDNKDSLVHALIAEGFELLNAAAHDAADVAEAAGLDRFERIFAGARAMVDFGLDHPAYYEIMFMLRMDQIARFPADRYRAARAGLDRFFEISGFPRADALLRGTALLASLHGLISLLLMQRVDKQVPRGQLLEHVVRSACAAALAPDPPATAHPAQAPADAHRAEADAQGPDPNEPR